MNRIIRMALCIIVGSNSLFARSIHRLKDPRMPELYASWEKEDCWHHVSSWHLAGSTIFDIFDEQEFFDRHLPTGTITYAHQNKTENKIATKKRNKRKSPPAETNSVDSQVLKNMIDELLEQLRRGNTRHGIMKKFKILKDSGFNPSKGEGLIVVKFRDYPFVAKIFMETPASFVYPYGKGVQQHAMFMMAGGANRHMSGLTRIRNLDFINRHINESPYWKKLITTPRKWFYLPKKSRWIQLVGKNIDCTECKKTRIPGTYVVICDALCGRSPSFFSKRDRTTILGFSRYLENRVDPFIKNYFVQEDGTFALIDTEHFPTVVGLRSQQCLSSYINWYGGLILKFFKDKFGRHKKWFLRIQQEPTPDIMKI